MIKDTYRSFLSAEKTTRCTLKKKYPFASEANENTASNFQSINWDCVMVQMQLRGVSPWHPHTEHSDVLEGRRNKDTEALKNHYLLMEVSPLS